MEKIEIITLFLIISTGIITNKGLKEYFFKDKYSFNVDGILIRKEYIRLISSGFLHIDWRHFTFNMITLFIFGSKLEGYINIIPYILIYVSSLLGGNFLSLYIHKNHSDYSAIGASGAISGVIFASIGLFPEMKIGFILLPIYFPAWLYVIGYILYSIYGITSQKDNIGHEAHLGGGITGLIVAIAIKPEILNINLLPISLALISTTVFLITIIKKPHILILNNPFNKTEKLVTIEDKYNDKKVSKQNEIDEILDKISKKGFENLSKKEKNRLSELSK